MSLILDALNRSRQDANPMPGLGTEHRAEPLAGARRPYLLWAALALAVVVIAALVVDRLRAPPSTAEGIGAPVAQLSRNLDRAATAVTTQLKERAAAATGQEQHTSAQPQAETQPQAAIQPQAALQPQVALQPQAAIQPAVSGQPLEPVPATAVASSAPQLHPAPVSVREEVAPPTGQDVDNDAVAQLYKNRDLPEQSTEPKKAVNPQRQAAKTHEEQPVDLDHILKLAQEEMKNAGLEDNAVPLLADLSQQIKDSIPTIYYQKHDYSSDPSVSSVVLNSTSAKVGGTPVPGLKVEQILRDSVVLSYHGTQFRLRALNSWINL